MISVSPSDKDTVTVRKGGGRGSWGSRGGEGGWGDGGTGHGYALGISRAGYWLEGGGGGVEEGRRVKVTCLGMTLIIHYHFFFCSDDFSN